jgi:pimeloyl-ACP methyl ester carboxylesterase
MPTRLGSLRLPVVTCLAVTLCLAAPVGASVPPGTVPPGTVPPGSVPPGSVPPGTVPPSAVPSSAVPEPSVQAAGGLQWAPCTDEDARDPRAECATLKVPLDYDHPEGATVTLALSRVRATEPRVGAMLFNPGGPGGSGFSPVAANGSFFQSTLRLDDHDIIGFDPRGVDRSGGIACVDGTFLDEQMYLDDTPDTPAEKEALATSDAKFAEACTAKYHDTLRFYSTANAARDMDAIRAALGDETISFLGISYGTYLGAVYATMFPNRVRAMVLDSAYEPNGETPEQQFLTQLVGFEGAFRDWIAWCEQETECAFKTPDVAARWKQLKASLDDTPLMVGQRAVNQVVLDEATKGSLYSRSDWPVFGQALAKAAAGDGSGLLDLADQHNYRNADGTYDSLVQSFLVISCASGFESPPPADLPSLLAAIKAKAPLLAGELTLDELQQSVQPDCPALTPGAAPIAPIAYDGKAPIVIVGGKNDPATPIRWAEEMTKAMGPSARMVTFTGEGHGQFATSTCVTEIEAAVLSEGTLPEPGAVCDPDPVVPKPAWWDALTIPAGIGSVTPIPAVQSILGLGDTQAYSEVRTATLAPKQIVDAFEATAAANNLTAVGTPNLDIADSAAIAFDHTDGSRFIVVALGPKAFDKDLAPAKSSVPVGATVVVLVAFPPQK